MIRLRSQKLLSGVSTLAVLAAFGVVDPVLAAGTTFSGPGSIDAIDTSDIALANRDFVAIDSNANVGVDGSGRSFYNPAGIIISGTTTSVEIDSAILQGHITNDGSLVSTQDGINVDNGIVNGDIVNNNYISVTFDGIQVANGVVTGGITNTGSILAAGTGIEINSGAVISGGILNSGLISGSTAGIDIDGGASVSGGITNSGSLAVIEGTNGGAIDIGADSFAGGITNDGTITGTGTTGPSQAFSIRVNGDVFSGGIENTSTGLIEVSHGGFTGATIAAVLIDGALFSGGITNDGVIDAQTTDAYAIYIGGDTFQGGITNSGSIRSDTSAAIYIANSLFQGGIVNSGWIESESDDAIRLNSGTFQGGINNQSGGVIEASNDGIYVGNTSFSGGITNAGLINSTNLGNAIQVSGSTFSGGITNSGTLWSGLSADAVLISGNSFDGGITNSGSISGNSDGVSFTGSYFGGGIDNQAGGFINGNTNAISISGTTFEGGITNAGQIGGSSSGTASDGINFSGTTFAGGINNSGTILGSDNAIDLNGTSFSGGITNSGLIESTSSNNALLIDTTTFAGGISNTSTGTISGDTAINITSTVNSFDGGITNAGRIEGLTFDGIEIDANTFTGGINNTATGRIYGDFDGIHITSSTTSFSGGITNAGVIASTDGGNGIEIDANTFTGGIDNSGTITGLGATGLLITSTTFEGGITNSGSITGDYPGLYIDVTNFSGGIDNQAGGLIQGTGASADGVYLSATNFTGDFTNSGTILGGTTNNSGVDLNVDNFVGDFTNSGSIFGYSRGVFFQGKLFSGDITNSGTIEALNSHGMQLTGDLYDGSVTNADGGLILADRDGIHINSGTTITGDIVNAGSIDVGEDGIDINGTVEGAVDVSGYIYGERNGIDIDGVAEGGITVSGTIIGNTEGAIDLSSATAAHTITQTAGLISGGEGGYALDLDNNYVDEFIGQGGTLDGDVFGGEGAVDNFTVDGAFVYLRGAATNIDQLNFDSGVGAFGVQDNDMDAVDDINGGYVTGNTLTFTAIDMNVNAGGTAYLGDLTTINATDDLTVNATGTLAYFVTTTEGTHGQVNATDDAVLGGTLHAVIDPVTFAAGTTDTYLYEDIITTGVAGVTNTFADVTTSSLFFTGKATYGTTYVDLELNRIDFGDVANVLGLIQTQNQQSIGNALETIFQDIQANGPAGNEFDDLFTALFGTSDPDTILAMYDEINGSEYAQLQQATLSVSNIFNALVGEQMGGTLSSIGGAFASTGEQRYAQAAAIMANDASAAGYGSHGLNRGPSGAGVWLRGFGQWTNTDADPEAAGYDQNTNGLAGGAEYAVGENASIGLAGLWSQTDVDFDTAGDSSEFNSWQFGAYGNVGFGHFYLGGMGSYASHDIATTRTISPPIPDAPFTATSSYNASAWSATGEFGGIWRLGRVNMQPSVAVAYIGADTDAFTETGDSGAYALNVQGATSDSISSTLALRASGLWTMGRTRVVPDIKIGWRHEFGDDRQTFTAIFEGDPTSTPFTIVSSEIQQDSALISAGATFGVTKNVEVFFDVNGLYNANSSSTNASGGLRLTW